MAIFHSFRQRPFVRVGEWHPPGERSLPRDAKHSLVIKKMVFIDYNTRGTMNRLPLTDATLTTPPRRTARRDSFDTCRKCCEGLRDGSSKHWMRTCWDEIEPRPNR
jgi:hypothetical protein